MNDFEEFCRIEDEWMSHPMAFIDEDLAKSYTDRLGVIFNRLTPEERKKTADRWNPSPDKLVKKIVECLDLTEI
jgi:hypothetical protein